MKSWIFFPLLQPKKNISWPASALCRCSCLMFDYVCQVYLLLIIKQVSFFFLFLTGSANSCSQVLLIQVAFVSNLLLNLIINSWIEPYINAMQSSFLSLQAYFQNWSNNSKILHLTINCKTLRCCNHLFLNSQVDFMIVEVIYLLFLDLQPNSCAEKQQLLRTVKATVQTSPCRVSENNRALKWSVKAPAWIWLCL